MTVIDPTNVERLEVEFLPEDEAKELAAAE